MPKERPHMSVDLDTILAKPQLTQSTLVSVASAASSGASPTAGAIPTLAPGTNDIDDLFGMPATFGQPTKFGKKK